MIPTETNKTEQEIREGTVETIGEFINRGYELLRDINQASTAGLASRELSLAYTRLEEGISWLEKVNRKELLKIKEIDSHETN